MSFFRFNRPSWCPRCHWRNRFRCDHLSDVSIDQSSIGYSTDRVEPGDVHDLQDVEKNVEEVVSGKGTYEFRCFKRC